MSWLKKLFGSKASSVPKAAPIDLGEFAERYASAARERFPDAQVEVVLAATADESRVMLKFADGASQNQFLGNAWQRYRNEPETLETIFADFLASTARMRDESDAPGVILPVIKSLGWHEASLQQLRDAGMPASEEAPFIVEPLAGDLVVTYVEDKPESMNFLSPSGAQERGLEGDALRAAALDNLKNLLPQLQIAGGAGRYAARLDRNFDSSMVLLFEHWRDRLDVRGEPVMAIAARDELLLCGSEDAESVAGLQAMARRIAADSAYGLSRELFVYRDGRLQLLETAH